MPELFSDRTWLWISAAFYAGAFIWATIAMLRSQARTRRGVMLGLIGAGLAIQTFGLHMRGMEAGGCPVRNTFEVVQFVIWSFTVLYLIVGPAFSLSLLGYFTSGLAAVMSVTSLLIARWDGAVGPPKFGGVPWIEVHASLALFAYGAFGTLALTSLMFLLQTYSLKRKHLRGVFSFLPPIVALETINFRLLLTGLSVLSVSIVLGAIYFAKEPESIAATKLLVALAVWCAYCAVFFLRVRRLLVSVGLAWSCLALFGVALYSIGVINSGMARHPAPATGAVEYVHQPEDAEVS
ncbi:MAG: cytochrome c biogenesis protein CcsA [Opitutaceae bacterium]|nr:cytochrome c biogenesis protein CcsA [Opitutaceae bacterium]